MTSPFFRMFVASAIFICVIVLPVSAKEQAEWKKEAAEIRLQGGNRITAIYHPADKAPRMMKDHRQPLGHSKMLRYPLGRVSSMSLLEPVLMGIVESPPIDGFVPYVAVAVTDARLDDMEFEATPEPVITGSYLTTSPQTSFAVGIFDTGASASLIGYANAVKTGIYGSGLVTDSPVVLTGASGSVTALASYPLGLFVDGLGAIEPNGLLLNTSGFRGESNVSIVVGTPPLVADLPTAIGAPVAVFYTTAFDNEHKITRIVDANEYRSPSITLYEPGDSAVPAWNESSIPLELRPSGAYSVQYWPTFDYGTLDFYPLIPSVIGNFLTVPQSLFFVSSVDLADAGHTAIDRKKFMFDTGAQVTVVGSAVASRLALNPNNPDFQVEITDVTGATTMKPGFYLDSLEIPALGQWFSATNVPVVMLDVASPEGGYLDGIIGMNLFNGFNMVFRGGSLYDPPFLDIKLITNIADIAPAGGDGMVNMLDAAAICAAWLTQLGQAGWNPAADIAPTGSDGIINFKDYALIAANYGWLRGQ